MEERLTNGKCRVCGGEIVEKIVSEFKPSFRNVSKGFHCRKCGIKYAFVPPAKKLKREVIKRLLKIMKF